MYYYSQGYIVLYVAFLGIIAVLLPSSQTIHFYFYILLKIYNNSFYLITPALDLSQLLQKAVLVIQDKVPIQYRYYFKAIYYILQDVYNSTTLLSSLPIITSSNFAQILPIIYYSQRPTIIDAYLQQFTLIQLYLTILYLRQNMQVLFREQNSYFAAQSYALTILYIDSSILILDQITMFYSLLAFLIYVYPLQLILQAITNY